MKKNYLFIIVLFFSYSFGYGQTLGDFRSNTTGTSAWTSSTSWETWNGTIWIAATEYPGQNTGTYTVTILTGKTITISSDLSTVTMGSLIINGTLVLGDGTSNQHITTLSTKLLTINSTGTLTFSGPKVRLTLPALDAVLIIEPSGTIDGSCTNNDEIFIDTSKYATCVGSGTNTYSFGDLIAAGGTVNTKITNPATNPVLVSSCTLINLTGGYTGTETNVTYQWKVRLPDGSTTTTINSGSLADASITTSTSFTPSLPGEYLVSLEVTTTSLATNVETRTFNVVDTTNPTITCPANITVNNTPGTCGAAVTYTTPVGIDNCSGAATTQTAGLASGANFPVGTTTNTFKVTDAAGLETSCSFTVTVVDNQAPAITLSPANITISCSASILPADTNGPATATDNCATPTIAYSDVISAVTGNNKTITRTWTATDANSNASSYVQTITVTDTAAPTFTLSPANITISCSASSLPPATNGPATATDNCSTPTIAYSDVISGVIGNNKTITRTWTATDANSNVSSYVQTITVTDTTPPTFTLSPANITISCSASILPADTNGPATATDNCATPTIAYSDVISGVIGNNKTITRTWTATDANSNVSSYVQTITVTDTTPPTFTLSPANITISCSASSLPPATNGPATATDNCATPTITYSDVISAVSGNNKTITRTWTATDANSNVSSYVQTITVTDTTPPTFTLSPASLTIACSASILPADTNGPATATDNCATPTIAYSDVISAVTGNNKTITRTWTATDANSNVSSYVQTITVTDTAAPTFTLSPASLTIACSANILPADTNGPATATDNCATPTIAYSDVISAVSGNNKTITRTWTATDANSNVSSYVQTITVTDTTPPTFTLSPANITISCSASSLPSATNGPATATDNCATPTIAYSDVISAVTGNNKTITRTWTATDANSNVSSYVQTITVTDTTPPTFTLSPANITISCSASSLPSATNGPATATDNCATPTIAYSDVISAVTGNNKTITRTWTATDANSNVSSFVQTITVTDTAAPTFTLSPASLTIACSASILPADTNGPATATDNCATPTIAYSDVISGVIGNNKTITRTWTATDANSNVSSYVQTITVTDTTPPTFTLSPANLTIACSASILPPATNGPATATDNCATPTIAYSDVISAVSGNNKTITRTWTATDANSNVSSYVQTITVTDTQAPTFTLSPANLTIACSASSLPAATNGPATATDNCATPTIAYSDVISAVTGNNKTITRTWTATDANSNVSSYVQTITVTDTTPPTFTLSPANITISCSASILPADTNGPATATDNCATPTIAYSDVISAVTGNNKTITRTWTATDANSNVSSYVQTITVTDTTPPTFTLSPANITISCSASSLPPATNGPATATDNCATPAIAYSDVVVNGTGNNKTITRTWTATDANSNVSSYVQTITVTDTQVPTFTLSPANLTIACSASSLPADTNGPATATDNCATPAIAYSDVVVNGTGNNKTITRTWTATDANSNVSSYVQTITVTDTTPPTFTLSPANITISCSASSLPADTNGPATATDNCATPTIAYSDVISAVTGNNKTITRTWTATDANSNVSSYVQTITVTDTAAPTITCPLAVSANTNSDGAGNCTTTVSLGNPTVSDNCTTVVNLIITAKVGGITINPSTYLFGTGNTTVVWTATDQNGNVSTSCNQTVTVTDNENPTIIAPANITTTTNIACTATSVALGTPVTSDNCSVTSVTNNHPSTTYPLGITTVTWTVTDSSNRTATATQTVTVTDNVNPTLTQGSNQSATTATGTCTASVVILDAGFSDNCSGATIAYTLSGATTKASTAGQVGTYTFNKGVTTITYTVTDGATPTNIFTGTKTVTITDNIKPVAPSLLTINAQCNITVPFPVATDNCDGSVTATTSDNRTFSSQGNGAIIWSFKDSSNNETIVTQNVVIDDTTAPVPSIASLAPLNITNCQIDSLTPPTANDNCKGIITGTTTTPFPITTIGTTVITWTYNDGNGNTSTQNQSVTLTKPAISGGSLLGYVSGLTPAATPSENIAITSCPDDINPITINLSGEIGTIVRWEKFEAGDTVWSVIANTTDSYNILFDYSNTKSTLFRVLVQVGNCTIYSNMVNVHAIPPDVPPILDQSLFNICLNASVSLVARSGYTSTVAVGEGGDFNSGQFPNHWDPTQWKIDNVVAGTAWTAAANNTKVNNWTGTNDDKNVGTLYIINYDNGAQGKKFGMAHGNYNSTAYTDKFGVGPTTLETPIFSLVGLQTASVDFDQAFNLHAGDYAKLELSLDGGATYTITLQELIGKNPPLTWDWQNHSPSTASSYKFANDNSSFDISDYIGNDNVRVKWTFFGTTDESVWAIDNITIPVRPYSDQIEWTDGLGNPGEYIVQGNLEVAYTFVPSAPGVHQYGATNLINGCRAYDPDGTALATVKVNYAYAGQAQGYTNAECGERTVSLNAYDNTKSADLNKANGAYPLALNTFSDDPGTMATGKWSVVTASNACGTYSFSNVASPTSTFSGDEGVYTLRWKLDVSGCYSDVQVTLTSCKVIDFDGINDYISFKDNYGLSNAFSIEVWVKPDPQPASPPSNIQTIISKRNANSLVDGYDLRLVGNTLSFNWNNGSQITSPFPLTTSRWYHVAVTYTGGIYRLYVDGIEVINAAGSAPISNSFTCLAGAMDQTGNPPNKPVNHFSGWMDELRIWNVGLSSDHVRQMMNQQITNNGTAVRGEIIPIDINGPDANTDGIDDQPLLWSNLNGYYRMDFITCGYLKPFGGKGVDGQLRNITSSQEQTAPLPYVSIRDGNWTDRGTGTTPWKYGDSVWDYPNSTGYNGTQIDWNIVQSSHNINSGNKDISVLGLISTAGKLTIAAPTVTTPIENNDGQGLWITHYLKLNGNIDLVGESQLVEKRYTPTQFSESILDATSTGFIKRDQQGKKNSFNYNYWSSPVSTIQGSLNNVPYTINNVIKDGTNSAAPKTINFGSTFDFADTPISDPIKTTDRWIWSYNSTIIGGDEWANYFQWYHVTSGGTLKVGEAFTMKGTGGTAPLTVVQNYSFIGKPNSGTITLNLTKDNSYLVGNPYPSALDADEFIKDNLRDCLGCRASVNSFSGALYFWDHFGISDNHNLAEYEGGYATYTLMGGVVAINNSSLNLNDGANGAKIPKRYIPVGQGFFIDGYIDFEVTGTQIPTVVEGGPILFKNSQRVFQRESVANSVFMKKRETTKTNTNIKQKIRLGFNSSIGAHRQLLVGADPNTTTLFDIGYDAPMYDTNANDMYWEVGDTQFVIQGVPDFNANRIIPLGIVVANEGEVTIKIDELENVPSSTKIYLHDNQTGMYHDLKNSDFKTALAIGDYNNRFSLTFESKTTETALEVDESNTNDGIIVLFSNNYDTLIIKNNDLDSTVNKVSLFNMLGQYITDWEVKDKEQTNIQIPIKNRPSGIYIVKVKTSKGESSKKIIIN